MKYTILNNCRWSDARIGELFFPSRGIHLETPAFAPVATRASVKAISQEELKSIGYQLILCNTYHLHLRPGDELISSLGGLHKFMAYDGAILTDSGGFQIYSLSKLKKFHDDGVEFRSHIDGSKIFLSPEKVLEIQNNLGSDIMMVLDDPAPYPYTESRIKESMNRTHTWAKRSIDYYKNNISKKKSYCFGIVQGGLNKEKRKESIEILSEMDFNSLALGGLSVGEPRELFLDILYYSAPRLPVNKPRYLMGVGSIPDILDGVAAGIDIFDCVLPTRNARRGQVFTSQGKKNLRNLKYSNMNESLDPECDCKICKNYSLAYLRHLFHVGEILALNLATYHNIYFFFQFMKNIKNAVISDNFYSFYKYWKNLYKN
jgi:queuine tRNA-ribosyltransferase